MKNVLILHGVGGHAGKHWQQWLCDGLVNRSYKVVMPSLPNSEKPDRKETLEFVEKLVKCLDFSRLSIIGHSLGVVTALDLIEKENKKIKSLVSVAGFARDYGAELNSYFMKGREIDFKKVRKIIGKAYVIYADNDPYVPQEELKYLADELRVKPVVIKNGGHLNTDAGYTKFPLLLKLLEKK